MDVQERMALTAGLLMLAAATGAWGAGGGPSRDYFVTAQVDDWLFRFRGGTSDSVRTGHADVFPIAVTGTIRTASFLSGAFGREYDLDLNELGREFTLGGPEGIQVFDGTTDGQFFYGIDFATGDVYRFKKNWKQGQFMWSLGGEYVGITYDPRNDTFWVTTWDGGTVENYDRDGNLRSSFDTGLINLTCLALDHNTGTLWMGDREDRGVFQGRNRSGQLVDSVDYGITDNTLGGEFDLGAVAKLRSFEVTRGQHIEGGKGTLKTADNNRMKIDSDSLANGSERMDLTIRFKNTVAVPERLDLMVEHRLSEPGGAAQLFIRNWNTGDFDLVDEVALGTQDKYQSALNLDALAYVKGNGIIEVRIRHTVPMPQGGTVRSHIDLAQVGGAGGVSELSTAAAPAA